MHTEIQYLYPQHTVLCIWSRHLLSDPLCLAHTKDLSTCVLWMPVNHQSNRCLNELAQTLETEFKKQYCGHILDEANNRDESIFYFLQNSKSEYPASKSVQMTIFQELNISTKWRTVYRSSVTFFSYQQCNQSSMAGESVQWTSDWH